MWVHDYNPVALSIYEFDVHWYGLSYLVSFLIAWRIVRSRYQEWPNSTPEVVDDIAWYTLLGVILGGKIGYLLCYTPSISGLDFHAWRSGMSFHGGCIGVTVMLFYQSYRRKIPWRYLTDAVAAVIPIGLGLGRIANFINGELWGRVTEMPWGIVFPRVDALPRHPSPLYEAFLEGLVLGVCLHYVRRYWPVGQGKISAAFLIGYGFFRILAECWREPDLWLGYWWNYVTTGQLLSLPMIVLGCLIWRKKP